MCFGDGVGYMNKLTEGMEGHANKDRLNCTWLPPQ